MILIGLRQMNSPVDFLSSNARTISPAEFGAVLFSGTAPTAARFLDQPAAAGIGNLLADRILWRAKVLPGRPARDLDANAVALLQRATRS